MAKTVSVTPASPTRAQILAWWGDVRGPRILRIMRQDGISYVRAVKRSRRRMIAEMAAA